MQEYLRRTVLAIDDDITILTTIRNILSSSYEVSLAKSVDMAWTILNNNQVDLILLDVEMPNVSGLTFIEVLKKLSPFYYVPVIFVTSHATAYVIRKAKEAGAEGFIVKPFTARTLLNKIDTFFAGYPVPEGKAALVQKLHQLGDACKRGQSVQIEELIDEVLQIHCNDLDLDNRVIEICKHARQLDYKEAIARIAEIVEQLSNSQVPSGSS